MSRNDTSARFSGSRGEPGLLDKHWLMRAWIPNHSSCRRRPAASRYCSGGQSRLRDGRAVEQQPDAQSHCGAMRPEPAAHRAARFPAIIGDQRGRGAGQDRRSGRAGRARRADAATGRAGSRGLLVRCATGRRPGVERGAGRYASRDITDTGRTGAMTIRVNWSRGGLLFPTALVSVASSWYADRRCADPRSATARHEIKVLSAISLRRPRSVSRHIPTASMPASARRIT